MNGKHLNFLECYWTMTLAPQKNMKISHEVASESLPELPSWMLLWAGRESMWTHCSPGLTLYTLTHLSSKRTPNRFDNVSSFSR